MTQRTKINILAGAIILFIILVLCTGCGSGSSLTNNINYTYTLNCSNDKSAIMSEILNKGLELGAMPVIMNDSLGMIRLKQEIYIPLGGNRTFYYTFIIKGNEINFSGSTGSTTHPNQTIADTPENRDNGYYLGFFILKDYLEKYICHEPSFERKNNFAPTRHR